MSVKERAKPRRLWERLLPYGLALSALLASVGTQLHQPQLFSTLRNLVFDGYMRWHPREYKPLPVRIVDIDEASVQRLGQWPWPRSVTADLLERLQEMGAAAIALDMVLSEPDRSSPRNSLRPWQDDPEVRALVQRLPDNDALLAEAMGRAPVVTAFVLTREVEGGEAPLLKAGYAFIGERPTGTLHWKGSVRSLPLFEAAASGNGTLNALPDGDGRLRKAWLFVPGPGDPYPGLAMEALRVALGQSSYGIKRPQQEPAHAIQPSMLVKVGALKFPVESDGTFRVHFSEPVPERYLPVWKVLAGEVPEELIRGHILFVGSSAAILNDLHTSPRGDTIPGVEVHAQALEQILQGVSLSRPAWALSAEVLVQLLIALVMAAVLARLGALWAALVGGCGIAGIFAFSYHSFLDQGLLLDPLTPSLTLIILYAFISLYRHFSVERERRWIHKAFSSYVSPNLVRFLTEHPEQLRLGGEKRECSFIFTDVAGFTGMVEGADPEELVALINDYLDGMVRTVFEHDGTVDRIVGDAVAVLFSAPVEQPDHAERAVACALALDRFAREFVEAKRREGKGFGHTRIGVHSGPVILGNFGGKFQLDYRAFGDAINTSARLESVNKHLGTRICVSGATVAGCPGFRGRPIATLVLKGKSVGIETYEPLPESELDSPRVTAYLEAFKLLEAERTSASPAFERLAADYPDDPLARLHWRRLQRGENGSTLVMAEK